MRGERKTLYIIIEKIKKIRLTNLRIEKKLIKNFMKILFI